MPEFNLYADENAPQAAQSAVVYRVSLDTDKTPRELFTSVMVGVDNYDLVHIDSGRWMGQTIDSTNHTQVREILDWLIEWEYAEWRSIGPEDSEVFALDKLTESKVVL